MQVKEIKNEGLKREYTVKLDAKYINDKAESQLKSMAKNIKLDGFRPGHVPMNVLKKRYGKNVMGEVIERSVNESSQNVLRDKKLIAAMAPKVEITSYEEGGDLDFKIALEVLPEIPQMDFSKIGLERLVCEADEKEVAEALERLAERNKNFVKAKEGTKAKKGDRVLIDFVGKINGKEFEGGKGSKFPLELGSGSFIAGFEDQLIGSKEGDDVTVKVSFPENYHKQDLAGVPAEFDVHVDEVQKGEQAEVNDEFAKKLGFADLTSLRSAIESQFKGDYEAAARIQIKKQLFDILDKETKFTVPECMYDAEFKSIWDKLQQAKKEGDKTIAKKSDEELHKEYGKIAERRVKLGILLSDVAGKNKLQVTQDELSRSIMEQARQFPGQERVIFEFYKKHPHQLQELRGPILEEKAVDFIIGKAKITERKVSSKELMEETEEETSGKKDTKKKAANS
jgi:trigger factor